MDPFYNKIKDIELIEHSMNDNKITKKTVKICDILQNMKENQLLHFHLILKLH